MLGFNSIVRYKKCAVSIAHFWIKKPGFNLVLKLGLFYAWLVSLSSASSCNFELIAATSLSVLSATCASMQSICA